MPLFNKVAATAAAALQLLSPTFAEPLPHQSKPLTRGGVASETDVCSDIGADALKAGGNAADSMVSTVFCVGVIGMYHSGIGGGGYMTVRSDDGTYEAIDFRETAPSAAYENMYVNNSDASIYGGLASGVPGELRGLEYLHTKYGKLPWADVMAPAIKLARDGFEVNEDLVSYMEGYDFLKDDPNWAEDFAPDGELVKLGDTMTRKRYAETLQTIADEGVEAFYTGPIAEATIDTLRKEKGIMTLEDLKNYTIALREPQHIKYRDHRVTTLGAPSSGAVMLSILNILDGYEGLGDPAQLNLTTHYLDEAMKFGYGQRAELGDPSFVEGLDEYQASMLSPETAADIRSRIEDDRTHEAAYYNPSGYEILDTPGTSHIATADENGMAVSLTTTINLLFGSQVLVPDTGVIMNNEMNDFSIPGVDNAFGFPPSPANFVAAGKRPLSSISASIVEDPSGELYFVIGAAGGSRIITATMLSIHHVIDGGMTTAEALDARRQHDQLSPAELTLEYGFGNATADFLAGLGHNVTWVEPGSSAAQGVRVLPGGDFEAAGEPRQKNSGGSIV